MKTHWWIWINGFMGNPYSHNLSEILKLCKNEKLPTKNGLCTAPKTTIGKTKTVWIVGTNMGSQFMTAAHLYEEQCHHVWLIRVKVLQSPASKSSLCEPPVASPHLHLNGDEFIWGRLESWSYRPDLWGGFRWAMKRTQVCISRGDLGWRAVLSRTFWKSKMDSPKSLRESQSLFSAAFHPLERACKPLPYSPPPTSEERCFSSVEPLLTAPSTRDICVLKEGVGEVWLSVRACAGSSPQVAWTLYCCFSLARWEECSVLTPKMAGLCLVKSPEGKQSLWNIQAASFLCFSFEIKLITNVDFSHFPSSIFVSLTVNFQPCGDLT